MAVADARDEAVRAYRDGELSRRSFVRQLMQAGVSAEAAAAYATLLDPAPSALAAANGDYYDDLYDHYDFYERPARPLPQPRYFPRQVVTADDLTADQAYFRERLRRHNRMLHGCGVIEGLRVGIGHDASGSQVVNVDCGAAIDPAGEEILLPRDVSARVLELPYLMLQDGRRVREAWGAGLDSECIGGEAGSTAWLAIGHVRSSSHPRPSINGEVCPGPTVCEPTRDHDGAELVLLEDILPADCVQRDPPADDPAWTGRYVNYGGGPEPVPFVEGIADLERKDPVIDFDWGFHRSPDPALPSDGVLAHWTRGVHLPAGRYRFTATSDDGVRVAMDGRLLIDEWREQAARTFVHEEVIDAGRHFFAVDWYENTGAAVIRVSWEALETGWVGRYHGPTPDGSEPDLSQPPDLLRVDPSIGFEWGYDSPSAQLTEGDFAVRWSRDLDVCDDGDYLFTVRVSGGIRLYVDGVLRLEGWAETPLATHHVRQPLERGRHTLRVDYHHSTQPATAKVDWERIGPLNPRCRAEPRDGYVVLAALGACEGRVSFVDDEWFARGRGFRRRIVPDVGALAARLECGSYAPAHPTISQLVPGSLVQGTNNARAVVLGQRLAGATAVSFAETGVVARVLPGGTDTWLPVEISVPPATPARDYDFSVITPLCSASSGPFGVSLAVTELVVPEPTLTPTRLTTQFLPTNLLPTQLIATLLPTHLITVTNFLPSGIVPSHFFATAGDFELFRPGHFDEADFPGRGVIEVNGIGPAIARDLEAAGIGSLAALASSMPEDVARVLGRSEVWAMDKVVAAQRLLGGG
jgi:PA14 domain